MAPFYLCITDMSKRIPHIENKVSFLKKVKQKIFFLFRLNHHPVIKVYNSYGNAEKIIVLGHVLRLSPIPRKTYRRNWIVNLFSVLRLFMVIPFSNAKIGINWQGNTYHTKVGEDGFFRYEIFPPSIPKAGWQTVLVKLEEDKYRLRNIEQYGNIYIPFASQYGFISDFDDTLIISHSVHLRRRLYVLFTKNSRSRKAFEGVANHYELLAESGQVNNNSNPFFYVSGSEWNLYDFIVEFSRINKLPKGAFLLSRLKGISQLWKSGQSELMTKFMRIVRIIEDFPHLQFVLLGDDSQKDPEIYLSAVKHFPKKIFAVYIRCVSNSTSQKVQLMMKEMETCGVTCCYFKNSSQAVIHSKMTGLIV
jgi:phosphatidate phosphatase APP1